MSEEENVNENVNEEANEEAKGPKMKKKAIGVSKTSIISTLPSENPKTPDSKSFERFQSYFTLEEGCTVADALETELQMGDIHYDFIHGFINIEDATIEEYFPKTRDEMKAEKAERDAVKVNESDDSEELVEEAEEDGF